MKFSLITTGHANIQSCMPSSWLRLQCWPASRWLDFWRCHENHCTHECSMKFVVEFCCCQTWNKVRDFFLQKYSKLIILNWKPCIETKPSHLAARVLGICQNRVTFIMWWYRSSGCLVQQISQVTLAHTHTHAHAHTHGHINSCKCTYATKWFNTLYHYFFQREYIIFCPVITCKMQLMCASSHQTAIQKATTSLDMYVLHV